MADVSLAQTLMLPVVPMPFEYDQTNIRGPLRYRHQDKTVVKLNEY